MLPLLPRSLSRSLVVVAALTLASPALAASHLTDVQYLEAARCQGLMDSSALGGTDHAAIDALVRREGVGRTADVWDRGEQSRRDASRLAQTSGALGKASLTAERDGACRALAARADLASTAPAGAASAN